MSLPAALLLFALGLAVVIYSAEKLVEATVGTAAGFGVSAFLISVVLIGFDPENLAVGAAGTYEGLPGIALGSVVGAAMVAIALALGVTAAIVPLRFDRVPARILAIPVAAVLLMGALCLDGTLSRLDGGLLLAAYGLSVGYLGWQERKGVSVAPTDAVEALAEEELQDRGPWTSLGLMLVALAAMVVGSELLVTASETLLAGTGLSETVFGMTILALVVSVEEVARELPAALRGRPDIAFGNVVGSVLAFFLFNAGVIALVRPVAVGPETLGFFLPISLATVLFIALVMLRNEVPRWAGAVLLAAYALFVVGGYVPGLGG